MAHWDEQFLKVSNNLRAQEQIAAAEEQAVFPEVWEAQVQHGVVEYGGQLIEIEDKELLGGRASICLPRSMQLIPRGVVQRESPSAGEQDVFTNEDRTVIFGLSVREHHLSWDDMDALKTAMTVTAKELRSDVQLLQEDIIELQSGGMVCCEYALPAGDAMYYLIMFASIWDERAVWGSFHFTVNDLLLWQPLSHALIRSLRFHDRARP